MQHHSLVCSLTLLAPISQNDQKPKQFVGNLPMNCLSVFDHFVGLALKGLMIRIFNSRPPKPHYLFWWNVAPVLNIIKNSCDSPENISDKQLAYNVKTLMALTNSSRASAIHHLDIRFMLRTPEGCMRSFTRFGTICTILKMWKTLMEESWF